MTLKPYPAVSRIAAAAAKLGHVISHEDGKTTIETTDEMFTYASARDITDRAGKKVSPEEAMKRLGVELT